MLFNGLPAKRNAESRCSDACVLLQGSKAQIRVRQGQRKRVGCCCAGLTYPPDNLPDKAIQPVIILVSSLTQPGLGVLDVVMPLPGFKKKEREPDGFMQRWPSIARLH